MHATTTRPELIQKLGALAADQVGADPAGVTAETHLVLDLNFDSLDKVEYTMRIEDEFSISIPDEAAETVQTVGQAADAVAAALNVT